MKFNADGGLTIDQGAALSALGTIAQPIIFTSINDDANGGDTNGNGNATQPAAGDWGQIQVIGTATFNYAQVLYGGSTLDGEILANGSGASVTFNNGLVSQSVSEGFNCESGTINIANSLIMGNNRGVSAIGTVNVVNSTLDNNYIGVLGHGGAVTVTNCIVSNSLNANFDDLLSTVFFVVSYSDAFTTVSGAVNYSKMTDPTGSFGDIEADPQYVDPANGNYQLSPGSPCIDAGDGLVAPPTDQLGDPPYNDPRVTTEAGVPFASGVDKGIYPDMGAYNFVQSAPSTIDLAAANVAGPAAAVAGQPATITWTEENLGSSSAVGGWYDEIDLVLNPGANQTVISAGDVLVATGTTLGPNQSLNLSATVTVPGGLPGDYFWQVVPDATGDVFQGANQGTGAGLSAAATTLSLPALAVNGAATSGVLGTSAQTLWYQVTPAGSEDLLLSLDVQATAGDIELYAAQGYVPTPSSFQFNSRQFDSPNPTLLIPGPQVGVPYFVIAYGSTLDAAIVPFTLSAATPPFSVSGVSPGSIGNSGAVTLTITGGQLEADDTFQLAGPGGTFAATQVQVQDSSTVFATFNLNGAATGGYSVVVAPPTGAPATLTSAVQVQAAQAASLSVNLLTPSLFRPDRVFQGEVVYENTGNVDMPAPILDLTSGGVAGLSLDGVTFSTSDLELIGASFSGPAGVLRPGQQWSIPFYGLSNSSSDISVQVNYELASDTTPVDFNALEAQTGTLGYDATDWSTAYSYFQQQSGPTWGGVVKELDQYATYVASVDNPEFDSESVVFGYAIHGSLEEATASATGNVYLNDTNHPLAGATVLLANSTTDVSSGNVSNPDGSFVVDGLPPGTYSVSVAGYLLPNPIQVTVPATGPATGLSIAVTAAGSISGTILSQADSSDLSGVSVQAFNTADQTSYLGTTDAWAITRSPISRPAPTISRSGDLRGRRCTLPASRWHPAQR